MGFVGFIKKRLSSSDPRKKLRKILKDFELPHFPKSVLFILDGVRDPNVPTFEVARRVATDPGIHLRVLKTVNSAAFGLSKKVTNIEHAVALLGRARLEALILPLAIQETLPRFQAPCLDQKLFWLGAARRGSLARQIAQLLCPTTHVEAFSAGLLQDMAIPVIMHLKASIYCPNLESWNVEKDLHLDEIEKKELGFDHQEVGKLMGEEWFLPEALVEAISSHHRYFEGQNPGVYLASFIRYKKDPTESPEEELILEEAYTKFNLAKDTTRNVLYRAYKEAEDLAKIFI